MSSWIDLSVINSILSGGILLVMFSYAYSLYSTLWKEVLRKRARSYIASKKLSEPTLELEYWRPILVYQCLREEDPVELVVKGGFMGVRIVERSP